MADTFTFTIDGVEVNAAKEQTILAAADAAGIYIPRLCNGCSLLPKQLNGRNCIQRKELGDFSEYHVATK